MFALVAVVFVLFSSIAAAESITVMMHSSHLAAFGGEEGLIKEFKDATGIDVRIVTGGTNQIREALLIEWTSRSARYDVAAWLPRWLTEDIVPFLEPLDDYLASAPESYDAADLIPSLVDAGRFPKPQGQLYMIPFRVGASMLYVNQGLLDEHGVDIPVTWDEFRVAAETLTLDQNGDGRTDVYGWAQRGVSPEVAEDFYRIGYAFGGKILSDDLKQCTLNDRSWVNALELMVGAYRDGIMPPDLLAWGRDDYILGMQQGRVAMSVMYGPYWGLLTDPSQSMIADQAGWGLVPHAPGVEPGRSQFSVWGWLISKSSQNKDAAWQFIQFLSDKEIQLRTALDYNNGPIRLSAYENPEYLRQYPLARDWMRSLAVSADLVAHQDLPIMEDQLIVELHNAFQNRKTPQTALNDACAAIRPLL